MRQLTAYTKKEFLELVRTNKFIICGLIFVLFGIMNPLIAKLTPVIMEYMSDQMAEMGITEINVQVDAMTSWMQFYKNIPIGLILFVLMFGGTVTTELQRGTLINMVTKGLSRWKIMASKLFVLLLFWTGCFYMSFGITYGYNEYLWDNIIASNLSYSVFLIYVFGVWVISLIFLFSGLCNNSSAVTIGTGAVVFACYIVSMVKTIEEYLPTFLLNSSGMQFGDYKPEDFTMSLIIVTVLTVIDIIVGILAFNKKNL